MLFRVGKVHEIAKAPWFSFLFHILNPMINLFLLICFVETLSSMGSKHNKRSQGWQSKSHFQGLHLTCGIHVLVYYPNFHIIHTQFITMC